jgi:hypothetical protein
MNYFLLNIMGDDQDRSLAFIDSPPEDLGLFSYCMARGERIGARYPENASVYLKAKSPGIKLSSLLGNTESYLIVNSAMKEVIQEVCKASEIEYLSFTLYNHKKRVHSQDYWIVNPIGAADCVNRAASEIKYSSSNPEKIVSVKKYVLDSAKVTDAGDLFRVPEDKSRYFISERLAKTFQEGAFTNVFLFEVDQRESSRR